MYSACEDRDEVSVNEYSVADLLGTANPCAIPKKELGHDSSDVRNV
jgi:hypothetical protein